MGRADGREGGGEKPWGRWRNVTTAAGASPGVDVDLFPVREKGGREKRNAEKATSWISAAGRRRVTPTSGGLVVFFPLTVERH